MPSTVLDSEYKDKKEITFVSNDLMFFYIYTCKDIENIRGKFSQENGANPLAGGIRKGLVKEVTFELNFEVNVEIPRGKDKKGIHLSPHFADFL